MDNHAPTNIPQYVFLRKSKLKLEISRHTKKFGKVKCFSHLSSDKCMQRPNNTWNISNSWPLLKCICKCITALQISYYKFLFI